MYKSCSLWPLERIGWACLPIYYMLFLTRIKNKQMTKQRSGCIESKKNIEFTPLFLDVCQCVLVVLWHHDGFKVMFSCLGPFHSGFPITSGPQEGTMLPATGLVYYSSEIQF